MPHVALAQKDGAIEAEWEVVTNAAWAEYSAGLIGRLSSRYPTIDQQPSSGT
jgi:hypothetical protein